MSQRPQNEPSSDESESDSDDERHLKRQLLEATEKNNFAQLRIVFEKCKTRGFSFVDTKDSTDKNNTLLHIAVKSRKRKFQDENTKIVRFLVENGADPRATNDCGETPSHVLEKRLKTSSQKVDWSPIKNILFGGEKACSSKRRYSEIETNNIKPHQQFKKRKLNKSNGEITVEKYSFTGNEQYNASGLKTSFHGVVYQLQLLLIFVYRATKLYDQIFLSTELKEAEKFDDVVLKYKKTKEDQTWTYRFVQVKHLLEPVTGQIEEKELFSRNATAKFSLHKYFQSFYKMCDNDFFRGDVLEEFVICTNTYFAPDAQKFFVEDKEFNLDRILFFRKQDMQKWKLKSDFQKLLSGKYKSFIDSKKDETYLASFLDKFRFIIKYPDNYQTNTLISKEMGEDFGLLNSNLLTNSLKNDVINWFKNYKEKKSEYLLIEDGKNFLQSIKNQIRLIMMSGLSLAYPEELSGYFVEFADSMDDLGHLMASDEWQILNITTDTPLLTSIKLNHILTTSPKYQFKDSLIFLELKTLCSQIIAGLVYSSFSSRINFRLLVIDCSVTINELEDSKLAEVCSKLLDVLYEESSKQLVIIGKTDNQLWDELMNANYSNIPYRTFDYKKGFANLTNKTQFNLLNTSVFFQKRNLMLKHIIDTNAAKQLIDNYLLVELLKNRPIRIDDLTKDKLNTKYVNRTLRYQVISNKVLENSKFLTSNVLIVSKAYRQMMVHLKADLNFLNSNSDMKNGIYLVQEGFNIQDIVENAQKNKAIKSVSHLEYTDGCLILKQCFGEFKQLRHFICTKQSEVVVEEETFLNSLTQENNKIIILAADPGFGKSSLISNTHERLIAMYPSAWIKRINLNLYVKAMENQTVLGDIHFSENNTKAAIQFLSSMLFGNEAYFDKNLFELSLQNYDPGKYKSPEIILLFDGFDEIAPKHKEKTLVLLKALQNCSVKLIWITTRTHEMQSLEDALNTLALYLSPFNKQQKFEFVQKHQIEYNDSVYNSICSYLGNLKLSTYSESNSFSWFKKYRPAPSPEEILHDALQTEFANVPLHLEMLITVSFKPKMKPLTIPNLYQEFIEHKFNIYYDEKSSTCSNVQADDDIRKRDIKYLMDVHAALAYNELFSGVMNETLRDDKDDLARIGFIIKNKRGIQFTHRSFAEYFVVSYLDKHIESEHIQTILWESVLVEPNYTLLRRFINGNGKNMLYKWTNLRGSAEKILEVQHKKYFKFLFEEEQNNIAKACLMMLKQNDDSILDDLQVCIRDNYYEFDIRRETDRKLLILLNILQYDQEFFSTMFPIIMKVKTVHNTCVVNCNPVHIIFRHYTESDITGMLNHIHLIRTDQQIFLKMIAHSCFESQDNILHIAARRGKFNYIMQLIGWLRQNNFWSHSFTENAFFATLVFEVNSEHATFLHVMDYHQTFDSFMEYLFTEFGPTEMKRLCGNNSYSDDETILHECVKKDIKNGYNNSLKVLLKIYVFETIREIIFKVNTNGGTALHVRCREKNSKNSSHECLINFCMTHFPAATFRELLLVTDDKEKTILRNTLLYNDTKTLESILTYLERNFNLKDVRHILFHVDYKRRTILHKAVKLETSGKSTLILLNFIKRLFGIDSISALLTAETTTGMTMLHYSCYNYEEDNIFKVILDYAANIFDQISDFKKFVFTKDSNGKNIFHHAFLIRRVIEVIVNTLREYFEISVIEEQMLQGDCNGEIILHHAVISDDGLVEFLMEYAKNHFDIHIFMGLLTKENNDKKIPYQMALNQKSTEIFGPSFDWLIDLLCSADEPTSDNLDKIIKIYWSQLDSLYSYPNDLASRELKDKIADKLNTIYNHPSWQQIDQNEWILKLKYNAMGSVGVVMRLR